MTINSGHSMLLADFTPCGPIDALVVLAFGAMLGIAISVLILVWWRDK